LMGGDPTQWYGTTSPVATSECVFQYLDGDVWRDFTVLTEMIRQRIRAFAEGKAELVQAGLTKGDVWSDFVDRASRTLLGQDVAVRPPQPVGRPDGSRR
jgi:hypothetical protein